LILPKRRLLPVNRQSVTSHEESSIYATLVEPQTSHLVFFSGKLKCLRGSQNHYSSKCNIATSESFEINRISRHNAFKTAGWQWTQ